ncbi:probable FCF2 Essential nucleolar protein involved in the early steps of 35S rRNA processing [Rhynchosporium agropyri]|uniref:Probable FCF2 Essential nucleolar protein involved in the early steps of 35S rRNA processing n=1 Tax=Rhynchosporium agropyri TaxID=914238 RepID=A0A1E1JY30_9HELO|nr:probable FCF2 Essential nucleolar protein involved in the early steps of 35S rRNA processing [Rhynchosporium agropyri]
MADEDLSNEQLRQLLKDAEQRLRSKGKQQMLMSTASSIESSLPKITMENPIVPYIKSTKTGAQVDRSHLVTEKERKLANGSRIVEDPITLKKRAEEDKKASAGADWFNMPRTNLTPELKRDLQLLRMRDVLDPKRHYKKDNKKQQIPEFSQVGTIIQGPTEYFSSRLMNKDRKRTLVEEVLAGEKSSGRFKSKYNEIQEAKTSGKKAHYKKLRDSRKKGVLKR